MAIIYVDVKNKSGVEKGSKDYPFSMIQRGINVAKIRDNVRIATGTYRENITINKSLVLQGEGRNTTIINGSGHGNVVYISANNVKLNGLKITNGNNGIYLIPNWHIHHIVIQDTIITSNAKFAFIAPHSGGFHLIENCIISKNGGGSYAHQFRNSIIRNCKVFGNVGGGISVAWGQDTWITGNNIYNNGGPGIYLDSMTYTVVERNNIHKNKVGIHIAYVGNNNLIRENIFARNSSGIKMGEQYVRNNQIYHNNIIKNNIQANDTQKDNKWDNDYPSGGNYWSDYVGKDDRSGGKVAGDGIGDTKVPHLGLDNYPFVKRIKINMTPRDAKIKIIPRNVKIKMRPLRYLGNSKTKEIHDLKNTNRACQLIRMKSDNKVFFKSMKEARKAIRSRGYNGCRWCFGRYNTG